MHSHALTSNEQVLAVHSHEELAIQAWSGFKQGFGALARRAAHKPLWVTQSGRAHFEIQRVGQHMVKELNACMLELQQLLA